LLVFSKGRTITTSAEGFCPTAEDSGTPMQNNTPKITILRLKNLIKTPILFDKNLNEYGRYDAPSLFPVAPKTTELGLHSNPNAQLYQKKGQNSESKRAIMGKDLLSEARIIFTDHRWGDPLVYSQQ